MNFQPLYQALGFGRGKRFIPRCRLMRVAMVHDQHNLFSLRIVFINQLLDQLGDVHSSPSLGYLGLPSPCQRFKHYAQGRCALPFILIIDACGLPWGRWDRLAGVRHQWFV